VSLQVWRKGGSPRPDGDRRGNPRGKDGSARPEAGQAGGSGGQPPGLGPERTVAGAEARAENRHGLLVEDIRANGSRAELRPGDVILAIVHKGNQHGSQHVDQFNKLLSQFDKSATLTLLVKRGEQQTYITLKGLGDK
jgi:serine protease Do